MVSQIVPSTNIARPTKAKNIDGKFFAKTKKLACPDGGWAAEMERVDKRAKLKTTAKILLKKAEVALKMRDFKKSKTSAMLALSTAMSATSSQKSRLEEIVKKVDQETSLWSSDYLTNSYYKEIRNLINSGKHDINTSVCHDKSSYTNLNILQYTALRADVLAFEEFVSLGAGIDVPALEESSKSAAAQQLSDLGPAPRSSALTLCCMVLAMARTKKDKGGHSASYLAAVLEISIRLVRLGANIQTVLNAPPSRMHSTSAHSTASSLYGKSAFELARISKQKRLIDSMKRFYDLESVIDEIDCRCGSRMPWVECHAGDGATAFGRRNDGKELKFRHSPVARCPCKNTRDEYYVCCWDSPTEFFQEDDTGKVCRSVVVSGETSRVMKESLESLAKDPEFDCNGPLFCARDEKGRSLDRAMTVGELRSNQVAFIRSEGCSLMRSLGSKNAKSKMGEWDPEVYAGTIERIHDNLFCWEDIHWMMPKSELLLRVEEWNDALEKYCDDVGLEGEERQGIVGLHSASPLAPCGNRGCDKMERVVKEFHSCRQCKSIAYCCRDCQVADWKKHKPSCIKI